MGRIKGRSSTRALTLDQRRAFLKLPLAERRKRLAAQARRMVKHYQAKANVAERAVWQGGDIVDA